MSSTDLQHRNLPRLLLQAREAVLAHTQPDLRRHGLSDQQWRVLRVLVEYAQRPGGTDTGEVAQEAHLLGPSLTGVLNRMERDGLVSRHRCPQDGRRTLVAATPQGLALGQQLSAAIENHYLRVEQHLGKDALAQLQCLLNQIIEWEPR
jgi:homoprotocatechuate degradation regulator HpaR